MSTKPRENPFRTEITDNITFKFTDNNLDSITTKLRDMDYRAAIIGPHGHGKTTLM